MCRDRFRRSSIAEGVSDLFRRSFRKALDDFAKIVIDLENIGVKIEDEDQVIMILNSLPASYANFVETVKYSKEKLSLEEVLAALKQKQIEAKSAGVVADGLVVHKKSQKGRGKKGNQKDGQKSTQDKDGSKKLKCFFCHQEGHFRRDCPERKKANKEKGPRKDEAVVAEEEGYVLAEALPVTRSTSLDAWILDSGCSCHMTPHKE